MHQCGVISALKNRTSETVEIYFPRELGEDGSEPRRKIIVNRHELIVSIESGALDTGIRGGYFYHRSGSSVIA